MTKSSVNVQLLFLEAAEPRRPGGGTDASWAQAGAGVLRSQAGGAVGAVGTWQCGPQTCSGSALRKGSS